jgi:ferredoxin
VAEPARVSFWHSLREQTAAFFAGDAPLWRLSLPSVAPPLDLPGATLIEWGGAQRWLRDAADAACLREMAATRPAAMPRCSAAAMGNSGPAACSRRCPRADGSASPPQAKLRSLRRVQSRPPVPGVLHGNPSRRFHPHTTAGREAEDILRRCVHCGFCTATCPTYQLLGDELDGPRGRIYLIKQVLEGAEPTEKTRLHLDRCLTCRSCESTCPSGVHYSRLLDIGREVVEKKVPRSGMRCL